MYFRIRKRRFKTKFVFVESEYYNEKIIVDILRETLMVQRSLDSIVEYQLDRPPRGNWWPRVFCPYGFPMVIETEPFLEDGTPFPTLFWLTCPYLKEEIQEWKVVQ